MKYCPVSNIFDYEWGMKIDSSTHTGFSTFWRRGGQSQADAIFGKGHQKIREFIVWRGKGKD